MCEYHHGSIWETPYVEHCDEVCRKADELQTADPQLEEEEALSLAGEEIHPRGEPQTFEDWYEG